VLADGAHRRGTAELDTPSPRLAAVMTYRTRLAIGLCLLTLVATLGACSAAAGPQLTDRVFLSVAVTDGGAPRALVPGTRIRLTFQANNLGASAGCNMMGGTYRIDGGVLVTDALAMTEMGCDDERHAQDDWLSALLGSRPTIRLNGDELTLESGSVVVRLMDRKVVEPDLALVGPTWTVDSIISGDAVSSVPAGVVATIVFAADGTVTVKPGCNEGQGTWKSVGTGIEISGIGLTKKACQGPAGQLETAVMAVLGAGQLASTIDANLLTLQSGANGLQLRGS
jgi:heat shock protein HslJ